ncbi:hypothetical protein CJD36_021300 [Flavipsychrobacter stenotrophus]|uniref:Uncharacterized protein n=1 Tax=Flavipsychrobacter stenotrophus TaxID=2077091 RepID=A0A2S7SQE3_9BACT|nr:hypothetical protein [Flavipsychrobacter stenotrophus]PQJ08948.1 hypothetical protein CJD36_021300 [Flavipsychrobacter stenotrophus]
MAIFGQGFTDSEKYLNELCKKTFLSLWSNVNVFREPTKELCDLLVVAGDDIIIFSVKDCIFPNIENIELAWQRWFRSAVSDSAKQLWGAEKRIIKYPNKIYTDSKCEHKLRIPVEITEKTKFHLVLVAHGASSVCREMFGGSGSLMYDNQIVGVNQHVVPFTIGDLDVEKSFLHVLDDTTLDIILKTRDTVADFTSYLSKRKKFLRWAIRISSTGEEEMLAHYLKELNEDKEHDFVIPKNHNSDTEILFAEGAWDSFQKNPQRIEQLRADQISYLWDEIIEEFSRHAIAGTQYEVSAGGFLDSERAIRFLSLETRLTRRVLARGLSEMITQTPSNLRRIRVFPMNHDGILDRIRRQQLRSIIGRAS